MVKGSHHTAETKAKLSAVVHSPERRAQNSRSHRGKKHSVETLAKMSVARKGRKQSPEHVARRMAAIKENGTQYRPSDEAKIRKWIDAGLDAQRRGPTKIELQLAEILTEMGIEFQTEARIGRYNVDFKIDDTIVEVYGCYWHACDCATNFREGAREKDAKRVAFLEDLGYKVVVIWEHELKAGNLSALDDLRSWSPS